METLALPFWLIGAVASTVGVFGWSHTSLRRKMDKYPEKESVRFMVEDKLKPLDVDIRGLTRRMDRLEHKIDKILHCVNK